MRTIAVVWFVLIIVCVFAYFGNIIDVLTKKEFQTMTVPNVVCGAGIFVPPVGMVCGLFR